MTEVALPHLVVSGAMTLVVGWKSGGKFQLRRVNMSQEVEAELRMIAEAVAADLSEREVEPWTADAASSDEVVHIMPEAVIGPSPPLARDVDQHGGLMDALLAAALLPPVTSDTLPAAELSFYALVIGDDPDERTVWIRRTNPRRGLRRGRMFTSLRDTLTRVDEPLFGFEDDLDLAFADGQLVVMYRAAFVALFRDNDALRAQVPAWIAEVTQHLPISAESEALLADRCQRDSRLRTRLEAISARGHLAAVSRARLRKEMRAYGLKPELLFNAAGELDFSVEDIPEIMKVLNEDLFKGGLSGTVFRVDRKAPNV